MLTHPKILVWGAYNFEKMPKAGFRNVTDSFRSPIKTKLMVIETTNNAQNDC